MIDAKVIGRRLRELRGSRTRQSVAEACSISLSAIAMYETGERIPRDDIKIKLSKLYKRSVQSIFFK